MAGPNNNTLPIILQTLAANGGEFEGTCNLLEIIDAPAITVLNNIALARRLHLIRSIYPRSYKQYGNGRGNYTILQLTNKGWKEVNNAIS